MIMSVFMFKKVVCTIVSTLCILFLLSACNASIDDYESYKNLKVGEHFSVNSHNKRYASCLAQPS